MSSPIDYNDDKLLSPVVDNIANFDFMRGFLTGTKVFGELKLCTYPEEVLKIVDKIYNIIINIFERKEIIPSSIEMLIKLKELFDYSSLLIKTCREDMGTLEKGFRDLNLYFSHVDYPQRLIDHSIENIVNIKKILETYKIEFKELSTFENGKNLGNIVRFILFWDFDIIN